MTKIDTKSDLIFNGFSFIVLKLTNDDGCRQIFQTLFAICNMCFMKGTSKWLVNKHGNWGHNCWYNEHDEDLFDS